MNRDGRVKRQNEGQIKERYQVCYSKFIEGQFSYSSHVLLRRICENGQNEPYMTGIPLGKIMLEVVKITMMNELQILFLGSTLQEMKWKVTDHCLNQYVDEVTDVTPDLEKDIQARRVQLSLLLIAYIVKIYLNEENSLVDFKIRDITKGNFDKMYQNWVQKVQNHFKFNPKNMNRLFRQFDSSKSQRKFQIVDYNKLVSDFFKQNETKVEHVDNSEDNPRIGEDDGYFEREQVPEHHIFNRQSSQAPLGRQISEGFNRRPSSTQIRSEGRDHRKWMIRNESIDERE